MQILKKVHRDTYAGEHVVTTLRYENSEWNHEKEFVPNSVFNIHTTTQAVAIGNGESRLKFDLRHIAQHRGGLLAVNKLQSYGCNALYRDFTPDFLIANGDEIIEEIANSGYANDNIVYTHAAHIINYPGKFYLVPQNVHIDAGALAAYMAAFDGHKKVFLIGYDQYDHHQAANNVYKNTPGYPDNDEYHNGDFLALSLSKIAKIYHDTEFVRVMPERTHWLHPYFLPLPNFRQINYRDFVVEADI
jgi:hypothetical protein